MKKYYFIGAGIGVLILSAFFVYFLAPAYFDNFLIFWIGCSLCWISIRPIVATYRCKEKASAKLIDYGFEQFKAHLTSSPVFTYEYQGKVYRTSAAECLSQRYALKHFKEGEIYTIYFSKGNPSFIKLSRSVRPVDIILLIIGMAMVILSVL